MNELFRFGDAKVNLFFLIRLKSTRREAGVRIVQRNKVCALKQAAVSRF